MPFNFTDDQLLLINLLLRIAVMAGVISLVLGFRFAADLLMTSRPSPGSRARLGVLLGVIFVLGVIARKHTFQGAMDLSLEGTLLAGFLGGLWVGTGVGGAVGAVCYLLGETIALPFYLAAGIMSGALCSALNRRGEIWSYSLNPVLIFYNFLERLSRRTLDRGIIPFVLCILCALARYWLIDRYGSVRIFGLGPRYGLLVVVDFISVVYTLGIALKIASNARMEMLMREEEKQLIHARLTTLRSQINPHFLFNTLNSISALIRTDPDKAREMTRRLSSIFRKSLEESADLYQLREELELIDDYLSIERVRFGDEKMRVEKRIAPGTEKALVPVMILQPIVENAVKHGISRLADGGLIVIETQRERDGVDLIVRNSGPGLDSDDLELLCRRGLGLRNVIERLRIYGCGKERFGISVDEGGTVTVRMFVPGFGERRRTFADQGDDCR